MTLTIGAGKEFVKSNALDDTIMFIAALGLQPEVRDELCTMARQIAMDTWKAGVKSGYLKILQDHRAGFINVSNAPVGKINEAIALAQNGDLMPSEFFNTK